MRIRCEAGSRSLPQHCLKIYRDRIEYRDKTKYWKNIIKCDCGAEEKCKAYALVPLTSNEEKLGRFDDKIRSDFFRGDNIHFEIKRPGKTMGHFYVSSSGAAWIGQIGKNGQNPGIRERNRWAEFHDWMAG